MLGDTRLGIITKGIESDRDQRSLARQCCRIIPKSRIKSIKGTIGSLDVQSLLPTTNADGSPVSLVGDRGDAHTSETLTSNRPYRCERYAERRDYDEGQAGDELFREVKAEMAPAIDRQITFDEDLKLLQIFTGNGAAAQSRDVSTYTLGAGQEFSDKTATSDPLYHMELVLDLCGGDFIFMSRDVGWALRRHPVLQGLAAQNLRTPLTEEMLADTLMAHLNVSKIIIGRRMFQNSGQHQNLNIGYKFSSAFVIGVLNNVLMLDYSKMRMKEYEDEAKDVTFLQGTAWSDIVVADPDLTYAFDNVL